MNLQRQYLTKNACYISGKRHIVKGIMVHSTGANNPNLKRYVQPDDGLLGVNVNGNDWNRAYPDGRSVCVHAFIGKLSNGSIATYQTLPWETVGWHSGNGSLGSSKNANNTGYIGFEICEDGLTDNAYFSRVYTEAVELCAYLCKLYDLDPAKDGAIICHSEGSQRGTASSHADVMHWFPKHAKSMDTFRSDVKALLSKYGTALYLVRKSAEDAASQIGAYEELENAAVEADENPGYKVFDTNGNLIYEPQKEDDDENMTQEKFEEMYVQMLAKSSGGSPSTWAKDSCAAAKSAGVFLGDGTGSYNWQNPVTREALAVALDRAGVLD